MSSQIFIFREKELTLFARTNLNDQEKCYEIKFYRKLADGAQNKVMI